MLQPSEVEQSAEPSALGQPDQNMPQPHLEVEQPAQPSALGQPNLNMPQPSEVEQPAEPSALGQPNPNMPQPHPEVGQPAEPSSLGQPNLNMPHLHPEVEDPTGQRLEAEFAAWIESMAVESQGEGPEGFRQGEPSSASHAMSAELPDARVAAAPSAEVPRASRTRGPSIHTSPAILDAISPPGCRISIN